MGNCSCFPRRKSSGSGDSEVGHPEAHVSNWVAVSDFSSVPEEEAAAAPVRVDESPEETVYRPGVSALQVTAPTDGGYTTAPEDEEEEVPEEKEQADQASDDNRSRQSSEYLTSDEQEQQEAARRSPLREKNESMPPPLEDSTDEDEVTPQIVLNAEDQPVRQLPTPLRNYDMSPRTMEKMTYRNGRANRAKLSRVLQLRQEAAT